MQQWIPLIPIKECSNAAMQQWISLIPIEECSNASTGKHTSMLPWTHGLIWLNCVWITVVSLKLGLAQQYGIDKLCEETPLNLQNVLLTRRWRIHTLDKWVPGWRTKANMLQIKPAVCKSSLRDLTDTHFWRARSRSGIYVVKPRSSNSNLRRIKHYKRYGWRTDFKNIFQK